MAVNINADTTTGLELTSDTSGNINIQNDGTTVVAVTAPGVAVTGALSATGNLTVDTDTLYVDATNNRVGIGTSSPNAKTEIVGRLALTDGGGASRYALNIESNNSGVGYTSINAYNYATSSGTNLVLNESSGKVYIGCTSAPSSSVYGIQFCPVLTSDFSKSSAGSTGDIRHIGFYNTNGLVGGINTNGSGTSFNTSSDYRLKENNVNITDGIDRVKLLKPYRFNFIADADTTVDGFFAHEVQDIVPEAITGTKDAVDDEGNPDYQAIDQSKLVPLLTAALQEAITKIEDLEARIQALENA